MSEASVEFSRGLTALRAGDQSTALSGFLMALAIDPETPAHRHKALELLGLTSNYTALPQAVLAGLTRCIQDPEIDLQPLALVVRTLLQRNPMRDQWLVLTDKGGDTLELALDNGSLDGFLTDVLIRAVLNHAINISLDLEDLLTGLRRHGLRCAVKESASVLLGRHRGFFEALAIQAERTDFAWAVTGVELAQLDELNAVTDGQLILSAYQKTDAVGVPPLPELTEISDTVSKSVQSQYRDFPYPRWERLPPANARSLAQVLTDRFPDQDWPERFSGPVTGLSAGCGTGSGALHLARTITEWALIQHFMPERAKTGRPRRTCMRSVWNAIQYIAATGCQWSMLPKEFPPFTTVQYYFYQMRDSGVLDILNDALVAAARMLTGREATPTAGIIDSQSVKTTESGGPRGYDAGKKTKGRKRHIVTDTDGNLLGLITHAADIQDRDGASVVIAQALENHSSLTHIFADGGYSGDKLRDAMASIDGPTIEIVKRPPGVTGFVVIARRWVVERTFAWLGRCRRLAKDCEKTIASADAWTLIAAIRRSARLIARKTAQEF